MALRGPQFELGVAVRADLQQVVVAAIVELERADALRVAAVEALGQSQNGGESAHRASPLALQIAERFVLALRRRLPVILRDQRNRLDFLRLEPAEIAVPDQIVRVMMVALVADVHADVVHDRRVLQPLALAIRQAVDHARLIEQRRREPRDLVRVRRPVVAAFRQLDDAAPPHVGIAIGVRNLQTMPRDIVEDEPLAQRQIAQRQFVRAEPPENLVDENRAGDHEVRSPRFEPRDAQPFLEAQRRQILAQTMHLLGGNPAVSDRYVQLAVFRESDRPKAEDRSRSADYAREPRLGDLVEVLADLILDVPHELALVPRFERIAPDEPFGQPDDAELEAPGHLRARAVAARDFDAAAADVDDDGYVPGNADAVDGGGMNQTGFLRARNELWADAGLVGHGAEEVAAVFRFAGRAGGNRDRIVDAMRFGQAPEFREHLESRVHRLGRERSAVEASGSEPDHFLLAVDDLKGEVGPYLHHYHVDRVGADVDCRYTHVVRPSANHIMTLLAMPVVAGRSALLGNHLKRFNRTLHGLERGDVHMLHAARVSTRRLRELVPLLQLSADSSRKLVRRLRKMTKRLGAVRELDVLLLAIDELHKARPEHSDPLSRLAVTVAKQRDEAREKLQEDLPIREMRRLAKRLSATVEELRTRDGRGAAARRTQQWRWVIDARVTRRAERLDAAIGDAGALYLPERLHLVRIELKKLRYALELSLEASARSAAPALRVLKRQQDVLGRMHDLETLIERVRHMQATLAPPSVTVWHGLDRLVRLLDEDCRRLHARYMHGRPALEALVARLAFVEHASRTRSSRHAS